MSDEMDKVQALQEEIDALKKELAAMKAEKEAGCADGFPGSNPVHRKFVCRCRS